ncbi:hypothetical protein TTE1727 [Caldanaerobacter subterraneus subsp. tengcongensis MB4]|uniref:Uncharacterized protein n=1 Tax=Caldanaerobacter subterraneus subsp. tengcongensis (strain DSM 15242 / JCM 11007 / NBRC 100824 / MB4) TaxID=273068 RepID=Q8R990_CALS4|nr:hypothetical protein TTE1727 [Caldanaerobacter subterraneus subsp. tengcongensis MB4]
MLNQILVAQAITLIREQKKARVIIMVTNLKNLFYTKHYFLTSPRRTCKKNGY